MNHRDRVPAGPGGAVYGYRPNQPVVWFHKNPKLSNKHCLYCLDDVADESVASEKEHLIGREFVPTGTLDGTAFNFIFRSCRGCNRSKGDFERHVSTVTLLTSPARSELSQVDDLAQRKASKDFHPHKKGIRVDQAHTNNEILFKLGDAMCKMGFVGPPALDTYTAAQLAFRHVQGFFSLITSTDPTTREGTRFLAPDHFSWEVPYAPRDWGNPQLIEVVRRIQGWKRLGVVTTAQGSFRAEFRRDEAATGQWFWALEWNKSTRVIGVINKPGASIPLFDDLPDLEWHRASSSVRYRDEHPLSPSQDDLLFRDD